MLPTSHAASVDEAGVDTGSLEFGSLELEGQLSLSAEDESDWPGSDPLLHVAVSAGGGVPVPSSAFATETKAAAKSKQSTAADAKNLSGFNLPDPKEIGISSLLSREFTILSGNLASRFSSNVWGRSVPAFRAVRQSGH